MIKHKGPKMENKIVKILGEIGAELRKPSRLPMTSEAEARLVVHQMDVGFVVLRTDGWCVVDYLPADYVGPYYAAGASEKQFALSEVEKQIRGELP
jgi:hypothetical protein